MKTAEQAAIDNSRMENVGKQLAAVRLICCECKGTPLIEKFTVY